MIFLNKPCSKCGHQMTLLITPEENEAFLKGDVEYIEGICPECHDRWIIMKGKVNKIVRS